MVIDWYHKKFRVLSLSHYVPSGQPPLALKSQLREKGTVAVTAFGVRWRIDELKGCGYSVHNIILKIQKMHLN